MGKFICVMIMVLFLVAGCGKKPEASMPDEEELVAVPSETTAEVEKDEDAINAVFPEEALAKVADALYEGNHITEEDIERYSAAYPEICSVLYDENFTVQMLEEVASNTSYEDYAEYTQAGMNLSCVSCTLNYLMIIEELSVESQHELINEIETDVRSIIEDCHVSREDLELAFEHWDVLYHCTIN
jgi:predicted small lipoprotein YifL